MTIEKPKPQVDSPDPEWPTLYPSQRQDIGPITINGSGNQLNFPQYLFADRWSRHTGIAPAQHLTLTDEQRERVEEELKIQVAEILQWPRSLPDGSEIARAEQQEIQRLLGDPGVEVIALLGEGGSGKSALMATLGRQAASSGWHVVGMRLDRLPKDVATKDDLQYYLNLSVPLADAVHSLAENEPVLVLIDQLDALCDMMTTPTKRLALILNTVRDLARMPRVKVVLAIRPFEYQYSVQLRGVKVKDIQLALPKWEDVRPHIESEGVDPDSLSAELQAELTQPQILYLFLERIKSGDEATELPTYFAMRKRLWDMEVTNAPNRKRRRKLLFELAQYLADKEVLRRPLVQLEDWFAEVRSLESAGWLLSTEGINESIGFRHQSLFEYVYVRWMIAKGQDVAQTIIQNQRPSVRHRIRVILEYLRASDPEPAKPVYLRTLWTLWREPSLRTHLKFLLIDFLGQVRSPLAEEIRIVRAAFEDQRYRERVIRSTSLGADWFAHLKDRELPKAMEDPLLAGHAAGLLISAPKADSPTVNRLMREHWTRSQEGARRTAAVLARRAHWDEASLILTGDCLSVLPMDTDHLHAINMLCESVAARSAELAIGFFAKALDAEVTRRLSGFQPPSAPATDISTFLTQDLPRRRVLSIVEDHLFLPKLSEWATTHPKSFMDAIWPSLQRLLTPFAKSTLRFPGFHDELWWDVSEGRDERFTILGILCLAVETLAQREPDSFFAWLESNKSSELLTAQKLMMIGLLVAVESGPDRIVEHLRADLRHLVMNDGTAIGAFSRRWLRDVAKKLPSIHQEELAGLFRTWKPLDPLPSDWSAEQKRSHLEYARALRLKLLLCLDLSKLTTSTRAFIESERRALEGEPYLDNERPAPEAKVIGSPMSALQMENASDDAIVNLFAELHDGTDWRHPRHDMTGGSIAASRQLAELTKRDPVRGLRIARRLEPKKHERPVGMVLQAAAENANVKPELLFDEIAHHEQRGFGSLDYRWEVAYGLSTLVKRTKTGFPDSICELLQTWLVDGTGTGYQEEFNERDSSSPRSILLHGGYGWDYPRGNYQTLRALSIGYLCRQPPDVARWLAVLTAHLNRTENPQVWQALTSSELWQLSKVERSLTTEFLRKLVEKCPELLNIRGGLELIAHFQKWLPPVLTRSWLELLYQKGTRWSAQAYGELLVVRAQLLPEDSWAPSEIDRCLSLDSSSSDQIAGIHEGIALMSGVAVLNGKLAQTAVLWLVRLKTSRLPGVTEGILKVFPLQDAVAYGEDIEVLLQLLADQPHHLQHPDLKGLLDALRDYARFAPEFVLAIAKHLVEQNVERQKEGPKAIARHVSELVEIAIQLQEIDGFSEAGLDLFDQLQTLNHPDVEIVLDEQGLHGVRSHRRVKRRG